MIRRPLLLLTILLGFLFTLTGAPSLALACPASPRPVVELTAKVKPPDQAIATALQNHLQAQLKARDIDLCLNTTGSRKPIARVFLHVKRPATGAVTALIRIGDEVTDKRVERILDLTEMPADSRPLAVASAADELLRASWVELTLKDAPPPKIKPPAAVITAVESSLRPPGELGASLAPPPKLYAGVMASAWVFERLTAIGGDVWAAYWWTRHFGSFARARIGFGLERESANGSVKTMTLGGTLGPAWAPFGYHHSLGLALEAGIGAHAFSFTAKGKDGATATPRSELSIDALLGLRTWADLGPVRASIAGGALFGLRPATARDTGEPVASNRGVGGELTVGALLFW